MNFDKEIVRHWVNLTGTFFVGKLGTQFLRMIAGFLIIRWLSKDDYAAYTLIVAVQCTAAILVELGFSSGLIALIGGRFEDAKLSGRYVAAVEFYRTRLIVIGAVVLAVVFFSLGRRYDWHPAETAIYWLAIVLSLWFEAKSSFYGPILKLHQRIKEIYLIDTWTSAMRLVALAALYFMQLLSASAALIVGCVQTIAAAAASKKYAKPYIIMPDQSATDLAAEKAEVMSLTKPKVLGAIFFAFQGQLTIFLAGVFGQYGNIAEIGALAKIGLIFMLPQSFASALIAPWFAKLDKGRVLSSYLFVMIAYSFIGFVSVLFAYFFPKPFLWLLGEGYQDLSFELFLFSLSSALGLLANVAYLATSSRKWVYYWTAPASIVGYTLILVFFLLMVDLSRFSNIILLSVVYSALLMFLNQIVFVIGWRRDRNLAG